MDTHSTDSRNTYEESLPPRRGRIKREIFRDLAVKIRYLVGGFGRTQSETADFLNSNSTTPSATPSGYSSDASSGS
ncbi:hypothetical protein FH972_011391 [Carpinus fangiana]|uniref:Uncharacterized protein n=1 Tax=Carpinus fangiana TaxID=176857 RepID=A0A660KX98_9ROSI|nr:hypothetical protein FH972_011391 [Carpinus fangiana]